MTVPVPTTRLRSAIPLIDILCFEGLQTAAVDYAVNELNKVWNRERVFLKFVRRKDRPVLASIRPDEWLSENYLTTCLQRQKRPDRLLIGVTTRRLAQDYFACHFPDDGTAILTTYNNPSIPAEILEHKYLEYSLIYCFLDLVGKLSLWHVETRGCLFDDVPQPMYIGEGLRHWSICRNCRKRMHVKSSKRPQLKRILASVDRVLAELDPNASIRGNGSRSFVDDRRKKRSSSTSATDDRYPISSGYLTVDRTLMIHEIKRRWGINLGYGFADKPQQIANALQSITDKVFRNCKDWSSLKRLVAYNHTADGLHFDIPGKRHRDHTLHQLYVAILGMLFLDMEVPFLYLGNGLKIRRKTLRSIIAEILHIEEERVDTAWYISAILHDHGYPLTNAISRIKRMMRARSTVANHDVLARRLRLDYLALHRLMADPLRHVMPAYISLGKWPAVTDPEGFERGYRSVLTRGLNQAVDISQLDKQMPKLRYDHGVIGAANIGLIAEQSDFIKRHVCRAIYDHNLVTEISFEESPLSFLLKMCDTLQEWDRIVYCSDGEVVRESKAVKLGPFRLKNGMLIWDRPLRLRFRFERQDQLALTEWDATLWEKGTRTHLSLLKHQRDICLDLDKLSIEYERVIRS